MQDDAGPMGDVAGIEAYLKELRAELARPSTDRQRLGREPGMSALAVDDVGGRPVD